MEKAENTAATNLTTDYMARQSRNPTLTTDHTDHTDQTARRLLFIRVIRVIRG
jgi:hypothetical protein